VSLAYSAIKQCKYALQLGLSTPVDTGDVGAFERSKSALSALYSDEMWHVAM
jgi:predicted short-subunit dehydrogenase-like oxidoreductase (DUF2520 family)